MGNDDGDVDLYFRGYYGFLQKYMGVDGVLYQCDEGSPDTFTCMATMAGGSDRLPFGIFDTDYETYDIYYDCTDVAGGLMKKESFAVATRDMQPSDETVSKIKEVVAKKLPHYNLDTAWGLTYDNQGEDKCTYEWQFDEEEDLY